jgi:hypothetical protein
VLIETIRVQVDGDEGDDLLQALSVRGLASRLVEDEDGVQVEVSPPEERWETWNLEVVSALEAWLEEGERESVVARTDRHSYVVRAPRQVHARAGTVPEPLALPDVDDTARMPALAPIAEPALPYGGVFEEPQLHARRPRSLVLVAAGATVLLGVAGIVLLAVLLVNLL